MTRLPEHMASWVGEILGGDPPKESRATCDRCPMCSDTDSPEVPPPEIRFLPEVRCCNYSPTLANYNVGWILADSSPDLARGRALVSARITAGMGATPFWLAPGPGFYQDYAGPDFSFGQTQGLTCPYLNPSGPCSIWRYRDAVCATWFCRYETQMRGPFWRRLNSLLHKARTVLALRCALDLDLGEAVLGELVDSQFKPRNAAMRELRGWVDDDGQLDTALARRIWGKWHGREESFYLACGERAANVGWSQLRRLGGAELELAERLVRRAYAKLDRERIPETLVLGQVEALPMTEEMVYLRGFSSPRDGLRISRQLSDALSAFDGRATEEAVQAVEASCRVRLSRTELERFWNRGILVEPDGIDLPPLKRPSTPLLPSDRLRFFRGYRNEAVRSQQRIDDEGRTVVVINCGNKEITFDEPELLHFGLSLAKRQNGFVASEATGWGLGGSTLAWERVKELLETLLADDVLQRYPPRDA